MKILRISWLSGLMLSALTLIFLPTTGQGKEVDPAQMLKLKEIKAAEKARGEKNAERVKNKYESRMADTEQNLTEAKKEREAIEEQIKQKKIKPDAGKKKLAEIDRYIQAYKNQLDYLRKEMEWKLAKIRAWKKHWALIKKYKERLKALKETPGIIVKYDDMWKKNEKAFDDSIARLERLRPPKPEAVEQEKGECLKKLEQIDEEMEDELWKLGEALRIARDNKVVGNEAAWRRIKRYFQDLDDLKAEQQEEEAMIDKDKYPATWKETKEAHQREREALKRRLEEDKEKFALLPGAGLGGYAEGYLAYAGNTASSMSAAIPTCQGVQTMDLRGTMDPSVAGGGRLGLWFEPTGVLGGYLPDWARYFGVYTDFSYQRLNFARQTAASLFCSEGTAATWSFMFAGRCGLFPDSTVPFGRLQPYVAVGPGILFTSQNPTFNVTPAGGVVEVIKPGSTSDAALCLMVDAGVRVMLLANVSLDVFFRYRYAEPSFSYSFTDPHNGQRYSFTLKPTYHLFSGNAGVAIHF